MRQVTQRGFTLVELLVVISIIGTLVALLLPAVQSARETARNNTCKNNIKQLTTALMNMDTSQRKLPGGINAITNPTSTKQGQPPQYTQGRRASWVVMLFPYMEQTALWEIWAQNFTNIPRDDGGNSAAVAAIQGLTCPSDPPDVPGQPWLNYIGNAGQAFNDSTRTTNQEATANGVFFDQSQNTVIISSAAIDGREGYPPIEMTMSYIQSNDGTSKTMMVSESVHPWYWAYDGDPSSEGFRQGFSTTTDVSPIKDNKHSFGFVWSNAPNPTQRLNGDNNNDTLPLPANMLEFSQPNYENVGTPSSSHPSGVNLAFCDGHIVFVNDSMDLKVYGQLMTSNRKRSRLVSGGIADRKLPQPSDSDY